MRFLRFVLFAVFWVAVGLGMALLPLNGSTVWEKLSSAFQASGKSAAVGKAGVSHKAAEVDKVSADKEARSPLGNYTAQERAAVDKLIQANASAR